MNRFLIVSLLVLSACSGGSQGPVTKLNRTLNAEEKAEQRTLVEGLSEAPQSDVIGQPRTRHARVFELADRILQWPDGRRGYHFVLRAGAEEQEARISDVLIITDGKGDAPTGNDGRASGEEEKILEVNVYSPVS